MNKIKLALMKLKKNRIFVVVFIIVFLCSLLIIGYKSFYGFEIKSKDGKSTLYVRRDLMNRGKYKINLTNSFSGGYTTVPSKNFSAKWSNDSKKYSYSCEFSKGYNTVVVANTETHIVSIINAHIATKFIDKSKEYGDFGFKINKFDLYLSDWLYDDSGLLLKIKIKDKKGDLHYGDFVYYFESDSIEILDFN